MTDPTTKVFLTATSGGSRWNVRAAGAPTAPVYQGHAHCQCGAKIRLDETIGRGDHQRLTGLEYGIHYAAEHQ